MKFKFVFTPLKGLPTSSIVEGYTLVEGVGKPYSGKTALGYAVDDPKREIVRLIYSDSGVILEEKTKQM